MYNILENEKIKLNQSSLKWLDPDLNGHPEKFLSRYLGNKQQSSSAMNFGTLIHKALLENEEFIYFDIPETIKQILDLYYEEFGGEIKKVNLVTASYLVWNNNWKEETRLNKLNPYLPYLKYLSSNKLVITQEQMETIEKLKLLIEQSHIAQYWNESDFEVEKHFEYDLPDYTWYGTIDKLFKFDNSFRVIDLKTTSSPFKYFENEIKNRKYDRQVGFYTHCYSKITGIEPKNPRILMVQTNNEGNYLLGRWFEIKMEDYYDKYHKEILELSDKALEIINKNNIEQGFPIKFVEYE